MAGWNIRTVSVPIPDLLQGNARLHVLDTSFPPPQPILLRTGDANLDGFLDLLLIAEGRVRLLISTLVRTWRRGMGSIRRTTRMA